MPENWADVHVVLPKRAVWQVTRAQPWNITHDPGKVSG